MSIWDTASAAIDAAFGVSGGVIYSGTGINLTAAIAAIREDDLRDYDGGTPIPVIAFEIAMTDLPRRPRKGDLIREGTTDWRVKDVVDRNAVGKWACTVEAVR